MKINTSSDILLNVFFPLLLGYFIYFLSDIIAMPLLVKNYFPDGLWAYSFISAVLILWKRELGLLFKDQIKIGDEKFAVKETKGYFLNGDYYTRLGNSYARRIIHGKLSVSTRRK